MSTATTEPSSASLPTFAPTKRRKLQNLRRRRSSSSSSSERCTDTPSPAVSPFATTTTAASDSAAAPSSSAALHRPRPPKRRLGLEVTLPKKPQSLADASAQPRTDEEKAAAQAEAEVLAVVNRFTHQTGQVLDVDKHMVAYIEAKMSARRGKGGGRGEGDVSGDGSGGGGGDGGNGAGGRGGLAGGLAGSSTGSYWAPTRPEARGATLGKLHEVDLGEETKAQNIRRTQAALVPGASGQAGAAAEPKTRGRRRRNSQDVARDKLVEEVLKETRLDLYTNDGGDGEDEDAGDEEGAADDRIAEKFRKEFIDALISRRRRRYGDNAAKKKKDDKKRPKGPKLGGSRMARAQMREIQGAGGAK